MNHGRIDLTLPRGTTLLVATTNAGKLREVRDLLGDLPLDIRALPDDAAVPPEETGQTFAENARLKAHYYASATGLLTVAEDSGLEIDALQGAPGVLSARYPGATYEERFRNLFSEMASRGATDPAHRSARFLCALALASPDALVFEARGAVHGVIADAPRGAGGFGYDPIFFYPPYGLTLAEVTEADKARVSHRGEAFRQLRAFLERCIASSDSRSR